MVASSHLPLADPFWFIPRLTVISQQGKYLKLRNLHPEQIELVHMFQRLQRICLLKPRQIGATTIILALFYHKAYISADPIGLLSMCHNQDSEKKCNTTLRRFNNELPGALRPTLDPDNATLLELGHNGATFQQMLAGGSGGGRSGSYQNLHTTEMAFWRAGSSAVRQSAAEAKIGTDESQLASVQSAMHETANSHFVHESTANGPGGAFHKRVLIARRSQEWEFAFFPWFSFDEYQRRPPRDWERTDPEQTLARLFIMRWLVEHHGAPTNEIEKAKLDRLCDWKLAWRRFQIEDEGYGHTLFRKEYPAHWDEPFMLTGEMWFNQQVLSDMTAAVDKKVIGIQGDLEIYHQPDPLRRYFIGMDTSGGTGRDWAVVQVVDNTARQVAVWRSNISKVGRQGEMGAQLSAMYNRALVLCEKNNHGKAAISVMTKLGVNLWKNSKAKDWWTQGGPAGQTKKLIYNLAAELVDNEHVEIHDSETLEELKHIREQENGNIEADSPYHDDHADAIVLAWWCGRRHFELDATDDEQQRIHTQRLERDVDPWGHRQS